MRTAEEWESIFNQEYGLAIASVKRIRAIQLDALKEAAEIVHDLSRGTKSEDRAIAIDEARDAILARIRELEASPEKEGR